MSYQAPELGNALRPPTQSAYETLPSLRVPFVNSLIAHFNKSGTLGDALLRFVISCCENHAFRISWWDILTEEARKHILARAALMMHPNVAIPSNYLAVGCEGITDWHFEHIDSTLELVVD